MILIKSDPNRRIEIPGVPLPVRRPVDVDQAATDFTCLRTLRIYRFDEASVIEGHAEEDEVLIVVLGGSIKLTMIADITIDPMPARLSAPGYAADIPCAAYLPPLAAYKLVAQSDADVAYARATPTHGRLPKVFHSSAVSGVAGASILLEDSSYAERLRFRLLQFHAQESAATFSPLLQTEAECEAFVHIRMASPVDRTATISGSGKPSFRLESEDTVAISPGELPTVHISSGTAGMALIVMAK